MILSSFYIRENEASFEISGHSGSSEHGSDIVCAAASSAAFMTANTITEVLGVEAEIDVEDGYMFFKFSGSKAAADIVKGLKLHFNELSVQYPKFVKVTTEV